MEQDIYKLAISRVPGMGCITARKIVSIVHDLEVVFLEKASVLKRISGIGDFAAGKIARNRQSALELAHQELEYCVRNEISFISFIDKGYPLQLQECEDAPLLLYYKGCPDFGNVKNISVVGTRNVTRYGSENCNKIVSQIAARHPEAVIISGLALGVDGIAHTAALKSGLKTWAVIGHGFETIYPGEHYGLAADILEKEGAIITEYPHNSKIRPSNFVERNRIVAGLAKAVLVVESAKKGGAMITADLANQYNRDVFALPGAVDRMGGNGCNLLIKTHRAHLCEDVEDIEYITGWKPNAETKNCQSIEFPDDGRFSEQELLILEALKKEQYNDFDGLLTKTGLTTGQISTSLLELEFRGIIRSLPGKIFSLRKS
ncbi:MAG TPA: DNA-processing protein DprA [Bacteroidales bacterium]|nr:DNA-processing protein DprA [Bacteroidales bacterium]